MHVIRLRSAWTSHPISPQTFARRFHSPTGIENATVWLAVDELPGGSMLNGEPIILDESSLRVDITEMLQQTNELLMLVEDEKLLESVRLEIEPHDEA